MSFYTSDNVFTQAERAAIANTTITILDIYGSVEPGPEPKIRAANPNTHFDSTDHIFLLSSDEMAGDIDKTDGLKGSATPESTAYGFNIGRDSYTQAKNTRAMATDLASGEGVWTCDDGGCYDQDTSSSYQDAGGHCWLRSPGGESGRAADVPETGRVRAYGYGVGIGFGIGVRPALLTNKTSIICLLDSTVSPWDGVGSAWTPVTAHTSPPATIPTWVGANPARRSDDTGINHIMRMILKTEDLNDTIYTINAISPGSISLNAVASFTEQLGSFDMAAIKVPANANKRQGDFEAEGYYTFKYPYVFQVMSIEENTTTDLSVDFPSDTNRFMVFRSNHSGIAPSEPVYDTTYGSAALEIDLTTTPPTILTADAGLVISQGATIAFSPEITTFKHNLTLNGGTLHLNGPLDFSQGTVSINSGTLDISNLSSTDIITFPQGTRATSAFNIVPSDNWSQFIRNLGFSDPLDEVTEFITASRNRLAGATAVNATMDLIASSIANNLSTSATSGIDNVVAASASFNNIKTGSHIESVSGNLVIGATKGYQDFAAGVYLETGASHFDSFDVEKVGSGNSYFLGLGGIIRLDYKTYYLASSIHMGALKTRTNYVASTSYLGGFLELGKQMMHDITSYLRFSYGRTGAINANNQHVDVTNSYRLRLGAKAKLPEIKFNLKPYIGLAFEREFDGKATSAIVNDSGLAAPSLKGNTFIAECGLTHEFNQRLSATINLEGYLGRRKGISGGVGVVYKL